jgi:RimJ/RimL family protein N-acetyltransferase
VTTDGAVVRVEPLRREWIEALVEGDDVFAARFAVAVVEGWVGFPEALGPALDAARRRDRDPWGSHLVFDAADGALVGFGGFKGPPVEGRVEIGYAVAPARQGRGLATAAARWFVEQARRGGATVVVAHTLAEPNASTSVLTRCGLRRTDTVADEALGEPVWRWELDVDAR